MSVDLGGRVALVTGAGQGIGRGIALALADAGAAVTLVGRTESKVAGVAAEIVARGGRALAVAADVGEPADIARSLERTRAELGGLDILVNNAQSIRYAFLLDSTDDDLAEAWTSGPLATFRFMRAAHPLLKERRGVIVNMGSSATLMHDGGFYGVYTAAKAAIEALTRTAAVEWGVDGIRALLVNPAAESPMVAAMKERDPARYAELVGRVPLGRFGDAEVDIGRAVAWLVSSDAGYITGTTIMLDGGQMFLR
jgi:NAD(P)-dependent dehydrogenase (short-subunit alcohol dehydrogenase family)